MCLFGGSNQKFTENTNYIHKDQVTLKKKRPGYIYVLLTCYKQTRTQIQVVILYYNLTLKRVKFEPVRTHSHTPYLNKQRLQDNSDNFSHNSNFIP